MKTSTIASSLALVASAAAQRPADMSICDYYTTALLKDNSAANQQTVLTLVVNTAVIGNYTKPNVGIAVPGILTPGMYKGNKVNLAQYFDGMLDSSNRGGMSGVSVNFLDGGGAAPLMANKPANDMTSNQYMLLTHLYSYFADLLGCSQFGKSTGQYAGETSMYDVHKFMDLDVNEVGYFITQVGLSAASFGVADADVTAVGMALNNAFGYRCSPPAAIPATASPALQAICIDSSCPLAPSATCAAYAAATPPATASMSASGMPTPPSNSSMPTSPATPSSTVVPASAGSMTLPVLSTLSLGVLGLVVAML